MQQLKIENCQQENAELISNFLEELGAVSITMVDKYDDPILEPELGTTPLWPHVVIHAIFDSDTDSMLIENNLTNTYPDLIFSIDNLPNKDWEKECLVDFKPQRFGSKLQVFPSWIDSSNTNTINLILDPGLAFGTGSHATTSLCLKWLDETDLTQKELIDYGCGSGILGLAALKLGAHHVFAADIDSQALIATKANAEANNITSQQISIVNPNDLKKKVDILIANILLNTLIKLKLEFIKLIKPNGLLVVSGVLSHQTEELITAFKEDFNLIEKNYENDWAILIFIKKS